MEVDLNKLKVCLDYLSEINSVDLSEINPIRNGHYIYIPKEDIEEWKFLGLNNVAFLNQNYIQEK